MKPEQYNPKAREAFGKSLIDIGVAIFKAITLLITVVPITVIVKSLIDENDTKASMVDVLGSMPNDIFLLLLLFIVFAISIGLVFRNVGLRHIHDLEEMK